MSVFLQVCAYCKRPGATMGCCPTECDRSYHLPCALRAGCGFDVARHISKLGGLFCPSHLHAPEAAAVEVAGRDGSGAIWESAYLELRAEIGEPIVLGSTSAAHGASSSGSGSSTGGGLSAAQQKRELTLEEIEEERVRLIALSVSAGGGRAGDRCCVCSTVFHGTSNQQWTPPPARPERINPQSQDAEHVCGPLLTPGQAQVLGTSHKGLCADAAAPGSLHAAPPRPVDDDGSWWMAHVTVRCGDCGSAVHAGCAGISPYQADRVLKALAAGSPHSWRCDACVAVRKHNSKAAEQKQQQASSFDPHCLLCGHGREIDNSRFNAAAMDAPSDVSAHLTRQAQLTVTQDAAAGGSKLVSGNCWVHASCAMWHNSNSAAANSSSTTTVTLNSSCPPLTASVSVGLGNVSHEPDFLVGITIAQSAAEAVATVVSSGSSLSASRVKLQSVSPSTCALCSSGKGTTIPAVGPAGQSSPVHVHPACAVAARWYVEQVAPPQPLPASTFSKAAKAPSPAIPASGGILPYHPAASPVGLFCHCREPYDRFLVGCDDCHEWFHGSCIGLKESEVREDEDFRCESCVKLRAAGKTVSAAVVAMNDAKAERSLPPRPRGVRLLVPPVHAGWPPLSKEGADAAGGAEAASSPLAAAGDRDDGPMLEDRMLDDDQDNEREDDDYYAPAEAGKHSSDGGAVSRHGRKRKRSTKALEADGEEGGDDRGSSSSAAASTGAADSLLESAAVSAEVSSREARDAAIQEEDDEAEDEAVAAGGQARTTSWLVPLLMYQLRTWSKATDRLLHALAAARTGGQRRRAVKRPAIAPSCSSGVLLQ